MNSILSHFSTSILSAGLLFGIVACSNQSTLSEPTNTNPPATPDTTLAQTPLEPLLLYWSVAREDNLSTATSVGEYSAKDAGYLFARVEGCVFPTQQPGTVPLKLYWHPGREDNFTTATPLGEQTAADVGYLFARVEGYVFPTQQPGTVPLKLYWHPEREDNFTTATLLGEQTAADVGYVFARVEGYVFPASQCEQNSNPRIERI
ncbi:MAG: hypothetical protein SAL07_18485 [Oscillatoria sp. PMC 1051.18]|nr:hypothetical protein [Oscillatoria sp. PMC 1050.18]MEC5031892.1 hypothetical protein [Oscillatoria sp. PMC 1051.18]